VVTTRLHGAIIAYGSRVPYDPKVRAFVELYGGGRLAQSPEHAMALLAAEAPAIDPAPAVARSREFGARAAAFLAKATAP
jgi:polysaccharide pyruvyl transferase WcaK-like protein